MGYWRASLIVVVLGFQLGCAGKRPSADAEQPAGKHGHDDGHGHGDFNLLPATEPCPGPSEAVVVRVLDAEMLDPNDPIAFVHEPSIHWVVFLAVVEAVKGPEIGPRLGVLVHSPSMFASRVWGFGASPQRNPATLELRWSEEFCMFEMTDAITPEVEFDRDKPIQFEAPMVHAAMVGVE